MVVLSLPYVPSKTSNSVSCILLDLKLTTVDEHMYFMYHFQPQKEYKLLTVNRWTPRVKPFA